MSTEVGEGQENIGAEGGRGKGKAESSFERLQKRAFGGEDVATRPGSEDDDWWPKGPLLPGVQELTDDFAASINGAEGVRLVFLLGGAGNGKSYAARALGKKLGLGAGGANELAHRTYETNFDGVKVALLNDATIAPRSEYRSKQSIALAADIDDWWSCSANSPIAAFCCVNRGIVIDELRSLDEHGEGIGRFARVVLSWLATPSLNVAEELGVAPTTAPTLQLGDHYREQKFELEGRQVHIAALSVDAYSLFEPISGVGQTRAGKLFREIIDKCRSDAIARPEDCPVRANVLQWASPGTVISWEMALANAEVASGRLHSYRDIWGLVALTVLGPRFAASGTSDSLFEHIDRQIEIARGDDPVESRLAALLDLARFRLHNALFRAAIPTGRDASPLYPPTTPAHTGLSLIDPSAWGSSDSPAIELAMQGIALGNLPSVALLGRGLLGGGWSKFDQLLEKTIVDYVGGNECPDAVRRRLISWLGGYLIRMIGVGTGRLGNATAIAAWRQCHQLCASGPAALPIELGQSIRALIFPQHADAPPHSMLIPAFAVRAEPLESGGDSLGPKLAEVISHRAIDLQVRRFGSRLSLDCTRVGANGVVGQLVLDFFLIREALACRGSRAGQTESTAHVEPRVERCRASSLEAVVDGERRLIALSSGRRVELNL